MIWPVTFEERLLEWTELRRACQQACFDDAAQLINDWWFRVPMVNHYLHWDDKRNWPNPWDLLADNIYCDLARALGMSYTLLMLPDVDAGAITLVETTECNLVLVNDKKYILNYEPGRLVNIDSRNFEIVRSYTADNLKHVIG